MLVYSCCWGRQGTSSVHSKEYEDTAGASCTATGATTTGKYLEKLYTLAWVGFSWGSQREGVMFGDVLGGALLM